jgi:hypothetical protein
MLIMSITYFYTVAELAALFQTSGQRVRQIIGEARLPATRAKANGPYLIPGEAALRFAERQAIRESGSTDADRARYAQAVPLMRLDRSAYEATQKVLARRLSDRDGQGEGQGHNEQPRTYANG